MDLNQPRRLRSSMELSRANFQPKKPRPRAGFARMRSFEGGPAGRSTPVFDGLWAPAHNADVTKALAWRRAHVSGESVNTGLTRGHGARAVDRDCGSVWAGAPLPTLQRIYLLEPSFSNSKGLDHGASP